MINSNGFRKSDLKILVSNDDGIYSNGLWALVEELEKIAKVSVVAPDRDQSGSGTSITLRHPLRMTDIKSPVSGVPAYSVEGSPADSVILALRLILKDGVDLVVSGINEGPNLGDDVYVSGTVGAALQGFFYGIPALAFSIAAFGDLHFDVAASLARIMVDELMAKGIPGRMLLNVNLPNLPRDKVDGIEVTRLGERTYVDRIEPGHDGKKHYHWIMRGKPEWKAATGTDVWAVEKNRISITPLFGNPGGSIRELLKEIVPQIYDKLAENNTGTER
jgi:5'-nucleotidase